VVSKIIVSLYSKLFIMTLTSIQLLTFTHSLVIKIKTGMELTRTAPSFRTQYKAARGLRRNANAFDVLQDVAQVYRDNGLDIPSVAHPYLS
jgi:hypothetical protein